MEGSRPPNARTRRGPGVGRTVLIDGGPGGRRWEGLLEGAVRRVLESEGIAAAEVSVALLDDEAIRRLNREHLGRDRPTDVLAFSLWEEGEPVVGDVYLGLEQAVRQAEDEGVPLAQELVRLAVHGTLHVLGWDHPEEAAARADSPMFRLQERLVRAVVEEEPGARPGRPAG